METLKTAVQTIDLREPIPGYVLGDRLGAGGFGEVWRAEAPGGLAKAVKIVYGQMQGDRAEQELKALQRIKEVRHPMLLSLERIESVAEHLVIVMELADSSLRDRQAERQEAGLPGIPREELLGFLRDAADAMDYLVEHHSLLHLDIKPENLLLVADRVKVADFGLMRELDDKKNASMVGGMTPLYAAPEVFDGKPHRHSDQYSLAIVYQELLTGLPPFAGRTPAQLIAQHLHSQPNLKSLPTFDQPVIARALSKMAERRYPNCRALVDELVSAPRAAERVQSRRSLDETKHSTRTWQGASVTTTTGQTGRLAQTDLVSIAFPVSTEVTNLPPLLIEADRKFARPTLFVGVGEMGTQVLCDLKHRLNRRLGNIEDVPAFQFLAIDTDAQTLARASSESHAGGLRFHESLLLPLQDPQDYRAKSSALLEWMNRRWLYNIPRSHKTEGIRALGRLAFVDHFGSIVDALHSGLAMAMAPDSLTLTTQRTQLEFDGGPPRVVVVGSTTGGTSGGMLLDLGYTLRTLLKKMEFSDEHLCGIMTCVTPARTKARDLAVANTIALLGEFKQFSNDCFPGEPACELPSFVRQAPYTSAYFVPLDEGGSDTVFAQLSGEISDYLLLNTVTPAASFFDRCRRESDVSESDNLAVTRTFGLSRIDCQSSNAISIASDMLIRSLLAQWVDQSKSQRPANADSAQIKANGLAAKFAEMFGLNESGVAEQTLALIKRELGQEPRQFMRRSLNEIWIQSLLIRGDERILAALDSVDRLIGASRDFSAAEHGKSLATMLDRQLAVNSQQIQVALQEWLAKLVDSPTLRIAGARYACDWLEQHLDRLERSASEQLERLKTEIDRLTGSLRQAEFELPTEVDDPVLVGVDSKTFQDLAEYANATLEAASYRRMIRAWQSLRETLRESEHRLRGIAASLQSLVDATANQEISPADRNASQALTFIVGQLPQLVVTLDRELESTHLGQLLLLEEVADAGGIDLENLSRALAKEAKAVLRRSFQGTHSDTSPAQVSYDAIRFKAGVDRALPSLISNGGAKRVLVTLPSDGELQAVTLSQDERLADESVTMVSEGAGDVAVCFEAEQIPLDNVVVSLIRNRSDYIDLAARLHTRIDVDWQPFAPPVTQSVSPDSA